MTDRPIIFNAAMVNALIKGDKTQTRRVIKPQPEPFKMDNGKDSLVYPVKVEGKDYTDIALGSSESCGVLIGQKLRYVVGDRLWVRENCSAIELESGLDVIRYPADGADISIEPTIEAADRWGVMNHYGNRRNAVVPSIHMPRWASRLTLVVTDVRVQRLQDISVADAIAEGIEVNSHSGWFRNYVREDQWHIGARSSFHSLWNLINEARGYGWDANPWVVAVTFETHKCNIDQLEAA